MNVLFYSRTSTADQNNEAQLIELRQTATMRGWNVVAQFEDVISGSTKSRPALDALRARVKQGGIDAVVSVKIDRLGRSLANFVELVAEFKRHGAAIICTSQGIDTTKENPCGELMQNMLASFAQFERALIIERTRAGLVAARANGKIIGQPSKVLPSTTERDRIVAAWLNDDKPGGYKGLATQLGGCSTHTAFKLVKKWQAAHSGAMLSEVE